MIFAGYYFLWTLKNFRKLEIYWKFCSTHQVRRALLFIAVFYNPDGEQSVLEQYGEEKFLSKFL